MARNQQYYARKAASRKAKKRHIRQTSPWVNPRERISSPHLSSNRVIWEIQTAKDALKRFENSDIIGIVRGETLITTEKVMEAIERKISFMSHFKMMLENFKRQPRPRPQMTMDQMIERLKPILSDHVEAMA